MAESKMKIIVVDDDARLRDLLNRYLTEQGYAVRVVRDASRPIVSAIRIDPAPVTSQPPKLNNPCGASTVGSRKIPEPIMQPTVSDQHDQKPSGFVSWLMRPPNHPQPCTKRRRCASDTGRR